MRIELQYFEGCPHWQTTDERLRALAHERGLTVDRRLVKSPDDAAAAGFRGSPTILIDGWDPFACGDEPTGLTCRVYQTPDGLAGSPTIEQLRAVLDH